MARLALRQFLRSSFDPGDKTMASPIIACIGAATLLILASCLFAPISATGLEDYSDEDNSEDSGEATNRGLPLEADKGTSDNEGFVRSSNYAGATTGNQRKSVQEAAIGARSLRGRGGLRRPKVTWRDKPKNRLKDKKDYLSMISDQALMIIDILAREMDKGLTRISANADRHENGRINARPETPMGKSAGIAARKYLANFLKHRWVGLLAHVAQEAVDRLIATAEQFMTKSKFDKFLN